MLGVAALIDNGLVTLNYVAPEARFRGISKALMQRLENTARGLGLTACYVETTKTAARFYRALGYAAGDGQTLAKELPQLLRDYILRPLTNEDD